MFFALSLAAGVGWTLGSPSTSRAEHAPRGVLLQHPAGVLRVQMLPGTVSFAPIAEAVMPAVINIKTVSTGGALSAPPEELPDEESLEEELFRRFLGELPESVPHWSLGSGVIVDPSGLAITTAHVISRATNIEAVTLDGGRHKATVVGLDKKTDLALLRLEDGRFPYARLGDSDRMQVGDWVIAVGSPYGLRETVTAGIISAKARHLEQGPFDDFLQTDAAINPGNSGGPLVNMQGEVIGINTAIVAGDSGIGFATPSNVVKKIYAELVAKGRVARAWLGVSIQPLTSDLAKSFHAKHPTGLLVSDVTADSPAAKAGLRSGDILLELDGKQVETPGEFARVLERGAPGQMARLKVWRDAGEKTFEVRLGEEPDERETPASGRAKQMLGLEVEPITPDMGVIVTRVDRGSPAGEAGVRAGDVIREINRRPVRTIADFERLTKQVREGDRVTILLQRGRAAFYVSLSANAG